jgi:hypothetical protein
MSRVWWWGAAFVTAVAVGAVGAVDAARAAVAGVAPPGACQLDLDCDDGVYCNGAERCRPGSPGSDSRGCKLPSPRSPCLEHQVCNEALERCEADCGPNPDKDGDGHMRLECFGGDDCDDADPSRFPGLREVCDEAGHDEDCDPRTTGTRDRDGDGFGDAVCRNIVKLDPKRPGGLLPPTAKAPETVFHGGPDCDDGDARVGPNTQVCDGQGVKVCSPQAIARAVKVPGDTLTQFAWRRFACGASQACVAQPNGSGVCVGPPGPAGQPLPAPKEK